MKFIATRDFSQGLQNPLRRADGSQHLKRGDVVDIAGDKPITERPKDEYLLYSPFFSDPPLLVPLDGIEGRKISAEIKQVQERSRQSTPKPKTDWTRLAVWIALATLLAMILIFFLT